VRNSQEPLFTNSQRDGRSENVGKLPSSPSSHPSLLAYEYDLFSNILPSLCAQRRIGSLFVSACAAPAGSLKV